MMKTIEKLQQLLASPEQWIIDDYTYKDLTPLIECADGTTLSVQASRTHRCTPRSNTGPYTHVEVWRVSSPVYEFEYDDGSPSARVKIEDVAKLIDNHGGFKS